MNKIIAKKMFCAMVVFFTAVFLCGAVFATGAFASGIRVVPSSERVEPGEDFYFDVVAEDIPAAGLGTVQFRLNVEVVGSSSVAGVTDLGQSNTGDVSIATPLFIGLATDTRSGIGEFFWNARSPHGLLVMDNEALNNGTALYTYAHTNRSTPPTGSGSVARFMVRVGTRVDAERIELSLSEVMLLDGGSQFTLDHNIGATVELRCVTVVPDMSGLSFASAQAALDSANLTLGAVGEIDNPGGTLALGVVIGQSPASGTASLCESAVDLSINIAPDEVIGLSGADKAGDDTGAAALEWTPSTSTDVAGYRIYSASNTLLEDVNNPVAAGVELTGLNNGVANHVRVTVYDTFGNESQGVLATVTPIDDVEPVVTISGASDGGFYTTGDVTFQVDIFDTNLASESITLNGSAYDLSPITEDGAYEFSVTATDLAGNQTTETVNFTVDNTVPEVTVEGALEGGLYAAGVTPVVTVSDLNSGATTATLNGEPYTIGDPIDGEGTYTLIITSTDKAGNVTTRTITFTIDKTAPVSSAVVSTPRFTDAASNLFVTGAATVTITAEDSGAVLTGLESIQYSIDNIGWQQYSGAVSLSGVSDGSHTISYRAVDNAGNTESEKSVEFAVDNLASVTKLGVGLPSHDNGANLYVTTATLISLTSSDAASGVNTVLFKIDDGAWQTYTTEFVMPGASTHTLTYRSLDNLGNTEADKTRVFIVDVTAPASEMTVGEPNRIDAAEIYFVSTATELSISAVDDLSGVALREYKIGDGVWQPYTGVFTVTTEGTNTILYRSIDMLGNVEQEKTLTVIADVTPPVTTIEVGTPVYEFTGDTFVTPETYFSLTAVDASSGVGTVQYRIDQGEWTTYQSFTITEEGSHEIGYRSTDQIGNTEVEKTLTIIVDATPPVASIEAGEPKTQIGDVLYVSANTPISITAADNFSGLSGIKYRIDDGVWTLYDYGTPFTITNDGARTINYVAWDNLGNTGPVKTLLLTVDTAAPMTTLTVGSPNHEGTEDHFVTTATLFSLSAVDSASGVNSVLFKINDDGAWQPYTTEFVLPGVGTHTVSFRSIDNVGAVEVAQTETFIVDDIAPTSVMEVGLPNRIESESIYFVSTSTELSISATDDLSGVASSEYKIGDGTWQPFAEPFTVTTEGTNTILYRSVDRLGNVEIEKTLTVIADVTPPVTTIETGTPVYEFMENIYVTPETYFSLSAVDASSGIGSVQYRIDQGEWTTYQSFAIAAEGSHEIGYRSMDQIGNTEVEKALTVIVDATPPVASISAGDPKFEIGEILFVSFATPITITAVDNFSGVAGIKYRVDQGEWTPYVAGSPFTVSGDGAHTIDYVAWDNLGNMAPVRRFEITVDSTPPVTALAVGTPSHQGTENLYVTSTTMFTLSAVDAVSGVGLTQYRIDEGVWQPYTAPFTVPTEGSHVIGFRSTDNLGTTEVEKTLSVIVDDAPPVTTLGVGTPRHNGTEDLYATSSTLYQLTAEDLSSGVMTTEYRIDSGQWQAYSVPFAVQGEGAHVIGYRSTNNVGTVEAEKNLTVIVDDTAPETVLAFEGKHVDKNGVVFVASDTVIVLNADDALSGVATTYYLFDNEQEWRTYGTAINFDDLTPGTHTVWYASIDNVGNQEAAKNVKIITLNIEVGMEIVNVPRALVWVSDPQKGASTPDYTLADITSFVDSALSGVYHTIVTDKEAFKEAFRSGIYNVVVITDQDTPFDTIFIREMKEAVNGGMGLIVSGWGNSVKTHISDVLGVKFNGSQSMSTDATEMFIYDGPISTGAQTLVSAGRVLETELTTGTPAGMVMGDVVCSGVKGLTLEYQATIATDDTVKATLSVGKGKNINIIAEELVYIDHLPMGVLNDSYGGVLGDLTIVGITSADVFFKLIPYETSDYLEPEYYIEITVFHSDGSSTTTKRVKVTPTCAAGLATGTLIGPLSVVDVDIDSQTVSGGKGGSASPDVPAAVLNQYGEGKSLFLAFNIVESAMAGYSAEFGGILNSAVEHLMPINEEGLLAGGTYLIETTLTLGGMETDVKVVDSLSEGLIYVPLFDHVYPVVDNGLEFDFHMADGESATYRYFIRMPLIVGDYAKTTELSVNYDSEYVAFDTFVETITVSADCATLIQSASDWFIEQHALYPDDYDAINSVLSSLGDLYAMPVDTKHNVDKAIHHAVQTLHEISKLGFNTDPARRSLDEYIRITAVIYGTVD